ncbi:MAG: phage/plasmid primase, P4 family [Candidatus Electrothrix sp. GW3-4]|uniref:DNA primase family protein n=1 Tax=Candidatus Electrothrix sp. GW3-4 TaxID=3126740 RepID=UPI0030D5CD06
MSGLCWYRFDENCWRKCAAAEFEGALNALLYPATAGLGFSNNYQNGISQLLQKSGRNPLPDPLPGTIPFQNGLLDQRSMELSPVTPENAHTWVLPYEYSPDADCPNFLAWLKTALDDDPESIRLIQAWFNALLTGRPDLQVFFHLIGPAGTGKSTLGRLAFQLVGNENTTTTSLKELETNKFETANIHGKRLTAIEEADKYGGSVSQLKAMTGQDPLRLERKNKQQEGSFIYEGQTLMMSNERLVSTDYTSGLERRRITLEFYRRITKEKRAAWDKRGGERAILYKEAPGIINWALRLPREEVTDIFRSMPERVRRANLDAAMFNNPLFAWMAENLLPDSDSSVQIGVKKEHREDGAVSYEHSDDRLYPNYLIWCKENGRESVSNQRFSASVTDAAQTQGAHVYKKKVSDGMKMFGLRIRREGESSWLEELKGGEMQDEMQTGMKDNYLEVQEMQEMQGFSSTSSHERGYIPSDSPAEQVEVEF